MTSRKPHVKVEQEAYLSLLEAKPHRAEYLGTIARDLNVSIGTARRKLQGLEAQGKVIKRFTEDDGSSVWELVPTATEIRPGQFAGPTAEFHGPTCPHCGGAL